MGKEGQGMEVKKHKAGIIAGRRRTYRKLCTHMYEDIYNTHKTHRDRGHGKE